MVEAVVGLVVEIVVVEAFVVVDFVVAVFSVVVILIVLTGIFGTAVEISVRFNETFNDLLKT